MTRHAGGRGRSCGRAEDRACSADVGVHAGFADPEQSGDLFRRETAGDGSKDLTLTIRKRGDGSGAPPEHAAGNEIPGEDSEERGSRALHLKVSGRGLRLGQLARLRVRRSLERITSCSKRSRNSCPPQRGQSG